MTAGQSDSRLRLIEILKRRSMASVTELSQAVGLTPVTVRHHLESLILEGIVAPPVPRRKAGPGRPEMVYVLTDRADRLTPRNYGELCACLLQAVGEGTTRPDGLLRAAGSRLANESTGGSRPARLTSALNLLDQRGYFPTVEQDAGATTIVLANCPYLEVARAMPEMCQFDLALVEGWLGRSVVAELSIANHAPTCRLRLEAAV